MLFLKKLWLLIAGCLFFCGAFSQTDTSACNLRISLLTCGPGADLYTVFGHSGLRVIDSAAHTDIVFNYGTFEFDEDFYVNFTLGKLLYSVSEQSFRDFMIEYRVEQRSVIEQDLNLGCREKHQLYDALLTNAMPQNRDYLYQYLFDNCSTRPRDMVKKNAGDSVQFKRILPDPAPTFRNLLHVYLDNGKQYWSEFGIDLLLGSKIDRSVSNEESMFLPDYLMKGFDSATVASAPLVAAKRILIPAAPQADEGFVLTPAIVTIALLILGVIVTISKSKRAQNIFDAIFFFVLGLMGCFMLFMWFGTDHELCASNYNVLWTLPTHIIMAFFIRRNSSFVKKYFAVSSAICVLLLITTPFFPQDFHHAFFPLIILSALRGGMRAVKK
jgi:hypothetical protein